MFLLYLFLALCALAVLLGFGLLLSGYRPDSDSRPDSPTPPRSAPNCHTSDTDFIESYLHRHDERKRRHKDNQTPWY